MKSHSFTHTPTREDGMTDRSSGSSWCPRARLGVDCGQQRNGGGFFQTMNDCCLRPRAEPWRSRVMSFTSELFGGRIWFTQYLTEGKPRLCGCNGSRSPSESPTQIGCDSKPRLRFPLRLRQLQGQQQAGLQGASAPDLTLGGTSACTAL